MEVAVADMVVVEEIMEVAAVDTVVSKLQFIQREE
jgi:hypothetical protein